MEVLSDSMTELDFPFDEKKALQAAGVFVKEAGGLCDYYGMIKCLYAVEREALVKWGQPVIGGSLKMLPWGPINQSAYDALKEDSPGSFSLFFEKSGNEIRLKQDPGRSELSDDEISLIVDLGSEWRDLTFKQAHEKAMAFPECKDAGTVSWISPETVLRSSGKTGNEIESLKNDLEIRRAIFHRRGS